MINRNESQLLAKERSNRMARTDGVQHIQQPPAMGMPRRSANEPLSAPLKQRRR